MKRILILIFASALLAGSALAQSWTIDKTHSYVGFKVKHLVIATVKGQFNEFSGTINFDGKDFSKASVEVNIDPRTIDTQNDGRDKHLRSPDFFAADSLPEMKFVSTKVTPKGDNKFEVVGNLTMRGKTLPVTLDCEFAGTIKDPWGNTKAGFSATGKINRQDWGVSWSKSLDAGGVVVSDEVELALEVEAAMAK